ncbi:MAG TPA: hypothetical protein VLF59_02555 [Candidatus Saccharimonadales bacterium]|nr:hypothetical protein [Candidatus Saccharimonadales bacterium]
MEATITYSTALAFSQNERALAWATRVLRSVPRRLPLELEDVFTQYYNSSLPGLRDYYPNIKAAVEDALDVTVIVQSNNQLTVTDEPDLMFGFHANLPNEPFAGLKTVTYGFVQQCLYGAMMAAGIVEGFTVDCAFYIEHSTPGAKPQGSVYGPGAKPQLLRQY